MTLAILAVATALVGPAVSRFLLPPPAAAPVDRLIDAISQARDRAITGRTAFRGGFDVAAGAWVDAQGNVLHRLPEGLHAAPADGSEAQFLPCTFRLDGSGCRLAIRLAGDREWLLMVDGITGRVRLVDVASPG